MALEFLNSLISNITDFCGGLDEEIIRDNFVIVYEIIDEICDYGYIQTTDPAILQDFVKQEFEKQYDSTMEYLYESLPSVITQSNSVSEKDSERSVQ